MLAAVLKDFNTLVLEDVPMPRPGPDEVVVKIKACGICATDYKAIKGIRRNVKFPCIVGHEPSGIVSEVGSVVKEFKEGDEVIIMPQGPCGLCAMCRTGRNHYCANAICTGGDGIEDVWDGSFAEYTRTRVTAVFHKPKTISFEAAALTEPLSGAWKGVIQYSEMKIGDDVIIIGVGGIGLLCMMVAKAAGAGRLIAIDPSAYARRNALALGATHAIDPGNARREVNEIIPDGPDLVVEAAGPIQAVELARDLRRRGTRWNIFGITTHETFELDGGLTHFMEGRMDASFGCNPLSMQNAIRLMARGVVDPSVIVSHKFALQDIDKAIGVMGQPERNKVMILP